MERLRERVAGAIAGSHACGADRRGPAGSLRRRARQHPGLALGSIRGHGTCAPRRDLGPARHRVRARGAACCDSPGAGACCRRLASDSRSKARRSWRSPPPMHCFRAPRFRRCARSRWLRCSACCAACGVRCRWLKRSRSRRRSWWPPIRCRSPRRDSGSRSSRPRRFWPWAPPAPDGAAWIGGFARAQFAIYGPAGARAGGDVRPALARRAAGQCRRHPGVQPPDPAGRAARDGDCGVRARGVGVPVAGARCASWTHLARPRPPIAAWPVASFAPALQPAAIIAGASVLAFGALLVPLERPLRGRCRVARRPGLRSRGTGRARRIHADRDRRRPGPGGGRRDRGITCSCSTPDRAGAAARSRPACRCCPTCARAAFAGSTGSS